MSDATAPFRASDYLHNAEAIMAYVDAYAEDCAQVEVYKIALEQIALFGRRNPGYGVSCAKIAEHALRNGIEAGTGETQSGSIPKGRKPGQPKADAP